MAIQASGFTCNYTDPNSGINLPEAWVQIQNTLYVPYSYILIVINIYKDLASFQAGMQPVFPNIHCQIQYPSQDWNTYFDPDAMDVAGHNIQKQCMSWLEVNISNLKRK